MYYSLLYGWAANAGVLSCKIRRAAWLWNYRAAQQIYRLSVRAYRLFDFTLAVGYKHFGDDLQQKGLMPFVLIGFIINTAVIVALIAIALFRKGTLKFANWLISLLTRMHIVKRPIKWARILHA